MNHLLLTPVLRLQMPAFSDGFTAEQLAHRATELIDDLDAQLESKSILQATRLAHHFELQCLHGVPHLFLVVGLALRNQMLLQLTQNDADVLEGEKGILNDRQRLVKALSELPGKADRASVVWADRLVDACFSESDSAVEPHIRQQLRQLAKLKTRRFSGRLLGSPFQLNLAGLGPYEFDTRRYRVRARLKRKEHGFQLMLMRRELLTDALYGVKKLSMPGRVSCERDQAAMDRAVYFGNPVELTLRIGVGLVSQAAEICELVEIHTDHPAVEYWTDAAVAPKDSSAPGQIPANDWPTSEQ